MCSSDLIRDGKSRSDRYTLLADRTLEILTEYWFQCGRPRGILFLYRKFLKSSEIVYNRLEIKNDITKERRGLRHDVVYEVFCFGLG